MTVKENIETVAEGIKNITEKVVEGIKENTPDLGTIRDNIVSTAESVRETVKPVVDNIAANMETLKEKAIPVVDSMRENLAANMETLKEKAIPVVEGMRDNIAANMESLKEKAIPVMDSMRENLAANMENVMEQGKVVAENVRENLAANMETVKERGKVLADNMRENLAANMEDLKKQAIPVVDNIKREVVQNIDEFQKNVQYVLSDFQFDMYGCAVVVLGLLSLYLNGKLIYKVLTQRKREGLILNLAIANICLTLINFPLAALSSFQHKWAFGHNTCVYYGFTGLLFGYVMMTTIPMIALDDYLSFGWTPYSTRRARIHRLMISYAWINGLFWSLSPIFGWPKISYEDSLISCTVVHTPKASYSSYILCTFIFCYVIPIIILYMCKSKYRPHLKDSSNKQQSALQSSGRTMLLLLSFLICWTPYIVVSLWPLLIDRRFSLIGFIALAPLFAKLSTVVMPLILLRHTDNPVKVE